MKVFSNQKKIIILTYYHFPCNESVLENVFAKELGRQHNIIWLFQGDISQGTILKWHNSQVILTKKVHKNGRLLKVKNIFFELQKLCQLLCLLYKGDVKIVLVRDLPLMSFLIAPLKNFFGFKLYFLI